jgi:transcriptional regulator GlxA family with amidase domain
MKRKVAILVYDGAEVLDFSGPFEVFAVTSELNRDALFDVALVAQTRDPVRSVNGMLVVPNLTYEELPDPDILVIAGGSGSRRAMSDPALLRWVSGAMRSAEIVLSVCSGARILAALGLLAGREVTTHHQVFEHLQELEPTAVLNRRARYIDTGQIITTGGISAGIDGSFHVVARLLGRAIADGTAAYMEYTRAPRVAGEAA